MIGRSTPRATKVRRAHGRRLIEQDMNLRALDARPIPRPKPSASASDSPGIRLRSHVIEIAGRLATAEPNHSDSASGPQRSGSRRVPSVRRTRRTHSSKSSTRVVALLYELGDSGLRVIYDTFHAGAHYSERCRRVIRHARVWRNRLGLSEGDLGASSEKQVG